MDFNLGDNSWGDFFRVNFDMPSDRPQARNGQVSKLNAFPRNGVPDEIEKYKPRAGPNLSDDSPRAIHDRLSSERKNPESFDFKCGALGTHVLEMRFPDLGLSTWMPSESITSQILETTDTCVARAQDCKAR